MLLKDVLKGVKCRIQKQCQTIDIQGITVDSRKTGPGILFVALKGEQTDSHNFIDDVIRRGASAIMAQKNFKAPDSVVKIKVDDTRRSLPLAAANFYGNPSRMMKTIGITGTNGKTTITYILESIVVASGASSGVLGTINYRFGNNVIPAKNTTPGPIELQSIFNMMAKNGAGYAIMEVSSHSLEQHRIDGILFDVVTFTNISHEHLDYHKTMAKYMAAKKKIFGYLKKGGTAVINIDDRRVKRLSGSLKSKVLTYGFDKSALVTADNIKISIEGSEFRLKAPGFSLNIKTRLVGRHNISNILASAAIARSLNIKPIFIKKGIESVLPPPGRLEPVVCGQPFKVFVDFAHTEDALCNVLGMVKRIEGKNKIITVFGCGGNRDKKKRSLMGRAACRFSDRVIITSDNPRFEEPSSIIRQIISGIKTYSNYTIIEDRSKAIDKAISMAESGDVVIIAGKGHEKYQLIKDKVISFDDVDMARSYLRKAGYAG